MMVTGTAGAVLAIGLGSLICLFGYRLLRVTLGVAGFLIGAGIGWLLAGGISGIAPIVVFVIAVAAGAFGALLAAVFYRIGVFLLGAGIGALLVSFLLAGQTGTVAMLAVIAAAVLAGVVSVLVQRPMVSSLTALAGAWGVVLGAFHLAGWLDMNLGMTALEGLRGEPSRVLVVLVCWLVMGVAGALAQFSQGRKRR